ncbi:MAG: hypothetical protein WDO19_32095 [Bacteroidota bacterium]
MDVVSAQPIPLMPMAPIFTWSEGAMPFKSEKLLENDCNANPPAASSDESARKRLLISCV